jgi:hypothetical protein
MDTKKIKSALADITAEQDPTIKSVKLASLCSALWAERGVELVVVGGSAIEILTEGAYASGDLDMCYASKAALPVRERRKVSRARRIAAFVVLMVSFVCFNRKTCWSNVS